MTTTPTQALTFTATIYIAGDLSTARSVCRRFVMRGLCVTIEPTDFIYTGGAETGVRVGLINYPRFPCRSEDLRQTARDLAGELCRELCQHSYSIVFPDVTEWVSVRDEARS